MLNTHTHDTIEHADKQRKAIKEGMQQEEGS